MRASGSAGTLHGPASCTPRKMRQQGASAGRHTRHCPLAGASEVGCVLGTAQEGVELWPRLPTAPWQPGWASSLLPGTAALVPGTLTKSYSSQCAGPTPAAEMAPKRALTPSPRSVTLLPVMTSGAVMRYVPAGKKTTPGLLLAASTASCTRHRHTGRGGAWGPGAGCDCSREKRRGRRQRRVQGARQVAPAALPCRRSPRRRQHQTVQGHCTLASGWARAALRRHLHVMTGRRQQGAGAKAAAQGRQATRCKACACRACSLHPSAILESMQGWKAPAKHLPLYPAKLQSRPRPVGRKRLLTGGGAAG